MNYFWNFLTSNGASEFLVLLALAAAKSTVLLVFAAVLCLAFRRFSAATKHMLWSFVICASLLLPCLSFLTIWEVPILPAPQSVQSESVSNELAGYDKLNLASETQFNESNSVRENLEIQSDTELLNEDLFASNTANLSASSPQNAALLSPQIAFGIMAVWFAGIVLLFIRLLIGFAATILFARRAAEFKDDVCNDLFSSLAAEFDLDGKARLLCSERTLMPVVCGVLRPAVLLPASAVQWSEERLRLVLLHELTHVARRDCLTQILAQIACAFYWFNPLVWYAARRLRVEREQACDDRVLSVGTKPSVYAHHLLEIARLMQNRSIFEWSKATTVAMARKSQFEGRLLAILSQRRERCRMSRLMTGGVVTLICLLFLALAAIRPTATGANASSASETSANSKPNVTEKSLPDMFAATDSEPLNEVESRQEKIPEPTKKDEKESIASDDENLTKQPKNPSQVEPTGEIVPNRNALQNVAPSQPEKVQEQQTITQPGSGNNLFINTKYERKEKSEGQVKSGDFIDEMASVGYANLSVDQLIMLKTYRVTGDFVRGLRALGFDNLTPKTIANLRIYNVTPAYIEAMAAAGYKGLTLKELTNARIYKVTPEYAKGIQAAGYSSLSIGQLINFRIYNVTPELVRSARSRLGDLTPKQMISLKISGVLNKVEDKKKDAK